jgi:hypothetical protein
MAKPDTPHGLSKVHGKVCTMKNLISGYKMTP